MLYFAYGSNMNEDELMDEGITVLRSEKVLLRGYKIALTRFSTKRQGGVLDIIPSQEDIVEGVLYEVPDKDKAKIERKEGVRSGAYREIPSSLQIESVSGTDISGVVSYEVCNKEQSPESPAASKEYKNSALLGACEHGLSEQYRRKLKAVLEKNS